MTSNKKLKLWVRKLSLLSPILILGVSLSSGIAYASSPGYEASGVLGQQNNFTTNTSGLGASNLNNPNATAVDPIHHRLFVADEGNDRVLIYQLNNSDQLVSNNANYVLGASNLSVAGTSADNQNSFEYWPGSLTYDPINDRLFVMDMSRVIVFNLSAGITDGMLASNVLGEPDFTSNSPVSDSANYIYYTDEYGGGLAFDPTNERLFVGDYGRVLAFNVAPSVIQNGEAASYVLEQANFTSWTYACTQNTMDWVLSNSSLAFDNTNQRLFVSDSNAYSPSDSCNRVLVFNVAPSVIQSGENASYVLGQPNFTSDTATSGTANGLAYNSAIAYDPDASTLLVSDSNGERILAFNVNPSTIANDENAYAVIGQPDFSTYNNGTSQNEVAGSGAYYSFTGFAFDPSNNTIYYPDKLNNRVLIYSLVNGTNNGNLTSARIGTSYSSSIATSGSQGTLSFVLTGGSLPPGLTLNSLTGVISGTPTTAGTYNFEVTIYDNIGTAGTFEDDPSYTIVVAPSATTSVLPPNTGYGAPQSNSPTALFVSSAGIIILGISTTYIHRRRSTN